MKAELKEYDGCFSIDIQPETLEEAVKVARFGINSTKDLRGSYVDVYKDGTMHASVVIGKKKKSESRIK